MNASFASTGGGASSWWKPPGLVEISDIDIRSSTDGARRSTHGGSGSNCSHHRANKLLGYVEDVVHAPQDAAKVRALHDFCKRPNAKTTFFHAHYPTLCLKLLDVLAQPADARDFAHAPPVATATTLRVTTSSCCSNCGCS